MNNQNLILDIKDVTTESGVPNEPVTLQEMKDYMRLEGFTDTDESVLDSGSLFTFDNTLITNMIRAARRKAEDFCGVSIVFHSWKVLMTNFAGDLELPYGPVQTFTSMLNKDGTAIASTGYKLRGFNFQFLESPLEGLLTLRYNAGYEDCPRDIRLAIMQMVSFWYENRGDMAEGRFASSNIGLPEIAMNTLLPYKRAWTYVA